MQSMNESIYPISEGQVMLPLWCPPAFTRCFGIENRISYFCFSEFIFWEIIFKIFLYLFIIRKVDQGKIFSNQRKIWLGFQESVFLKNLSGKHFLKVVKNLEISYYLLIISNLVIKLLIAIYIYCFEYLFFNFTS
jgi:hypothetical protein